MKTKATTILLLISIWVLSACGPTATPTSTKAESVTISASTIAELPADRLFKVDLSQRGKVYAINDDADFARISIHTAEGDRTFTDLVALYGVSNRVGWVIGTPDDMRDYLPSGNGVVTPFDCGVVCKCTSGPDCGDLILQGKCADELSCPQDGTGTCYCVAKP